MSRPKKRTENGRLTREAAEIVIEMLREGVVKGLVRQARGSTLAPTFYQDILDDGCPYKIGDIWFAWTLTYYPDLENPQDIVGFDSETDRKEFKRRWRERYPKEVEPEAQVETKNESEIKLTYPLFAKSKKNGIVILFTSNDRGICVKSDWSVHALGECHNNWVHATDTDQWQHLTFAEAEAEILGEKKMTAHKHADLMLLYARDAAETDKLWERWEFNPNSTWQPCESNPGWFIDSEYRRKPQVIRVGRHEFPKPMY